MRSVPGRQRNSLRSTCTYLIARVTSPPAASIISPAIVFPLMKRSLPSSSINSATSADHRLSTPLLGASTNSR
ncbi:unnamed protein product [Musa acuminata subsp. malaccensis]|uniref:(wild Malaysian banana) hypothetical protein n=1 Tax=Musa acuminata subsp. malaccensis TaxID=214687 RepID=A0A804HY42_MUSAM|nr:unnamed protein product [Musa acuminata subsp. malaccensis]